MRSLALLALLAMTSGCSTLYEDTKHNDFYVTEVAERAFLGVVVHKGWVNREGVEVLQVLKESPAAQAGIQPGDRIVSYGATRVRSTSVLAKAISELGDDAQVEVGVVAKDSTEAMKLVSLTPTKETDYAEKANRALDARVSKTHVPFLYRGMDYEIDPALWEAYLGFPMPPGAEAYSEVNVLPIFTFSLFRVEDTDLINDASRVKILHWPLIITTGEARDEELDAYRQEFRRTRVRL